MGDDQRAVSSRPDVLTFTSAPLADDLTIAGSVTAEIWMTSTRPTWDLFVRLCEVDARGRTLVESLNSHGVEVRLLGADRLEESGCRAPGSG